MTGSPLTPRAARPRGILAQLACGAALLGAALLLRGPRAFVAPALGGARGLGIGPGAPEGGRDEARVQMRGRYATGTRSGKNQQGGGRLPIRVTRNPVLSYSQGDENEPASSVLRRMWDMYDMDFNRMIAERQRYFRPGYLQARWQADHNMRLARRMRIQRQKQEQEAQWLDWMRREGRKQGLTAPLIYNGPPLQIPADLDQQIAKVNEMKKRVGQEDAGWKKTLLPTLPKGRDRVPEDMLPGKWNNDGPENIFKIWKRPLHKWPYDIGKQGKWGPVVRGIVM